MSRYPALRDLLSQKVRYVDEETGAEKEGSIVRPDLLPADPVRYVAAVYGFGAAKYAPNNWRKGYPWSWSAAALERHWLAWKSGEDVDSESGMPHLAHLVFHAFALMEYESTHPERDDRYRPTPATPLDV